jgi:phospholipid/cholesterol/gamma-HCH transport system substrate-binding protein
MKEARKSDLIVGTTIIVTVVAILAAILWVQQADLTGSERGVVVRFRDVGGARLGNPVVIQGVQAGRIDGMDLSDDGWVEVRLALSGDTPLPRDPVVMLNESSLFGEWQATIVSRNSLPPDREVRQQIAEAQRGDSILPGATLPDIAKLTTVAGRIAGDVAQVAERVGIAFDENAAQELREAIRNSSLVSASLAAMVRLQSRNLDQLANEMQSSAVSVRSAAEAAARITSRIDSTASTPELRRISSDLSTSAAAMRSASLRVDSITRRLDRSHAGLDSLLLHADSILAKIDGGRGSLGLMLNDPRLYYSADSLLTQLRELAEDVKKNPKRYVQVRIF